jgi:hypothetical protein
LTKDDRRFEVTHCNAEGAPHIDGRDMAVYAAAWTVIVNTAAELDELVEAIIAFRSSQAMPSEARRILSCPNAVVPLLDSPRIQNTGAV